MTDDFPTQALFALAINPSLDRLLGQAGQVTDFLVGATEEDGLGSVAEDGLGRGHRVVEALAGSSVLGYEPCDDGGHDNPEGPSQQVWEPEGANELAGEDQHRGAQEHK